MQLPVFNVDALNIGFIHIRWYSLAYMIPLILSWFILDYFNKRYELKLYDSKNKNVFCDDYFFYSVLGIILGGRLGYVLFYDLSYFLNNPFQIIEIWKGGMSFHGGFIGSLIGILLFCRKHKVKFFIIADLCAVSVPLALFFGRIANFINLELYGRPTKVAWAMIFPYSDGVPRHPSQLYEAFTEGFLLFLIMIFIVKKFKFKITGLNSSLFLIFYSLFRIITECFREPDLQIGFLAKYFTMGQLLSLPIFGLGAYLLYNRIKQHKK